MKHILVILFLFSMTDMYCQPFAEEVTRKKLMGKHWAGSCKTMSCDTMEYSAFRKYDGKRYQWGSGYVEGMEFLTKDTVQIFQNVLCSDESNPADMPSRWELRQDTLIVDKDHMLIRYRIISLTKKDLRMIMLDYQTKDPK